jgi:hypothetical protein
MNIMKMVSGVTRAIAVAAALLAFGGAGHAQQKPSAAAVEAAKEIMALKGAATIFGALIPGVIEQGKSMFEQQNPALGKDLSEVAAKLRVDYAPRLAGLMAEVAALYASHFTETEIKEILAFYKTPVGKKMIAEEPKAIDKSMTYAQDWAVKLSGEVATKIRAEMKKKGHDI